MTQISLPLSSGRPGRVFLYLEADKLVLRCKQREVGQKQFTCNATNFATYSAAIVVDQYNRMLKRITVNKHIVLIRATQLKYNVDYPIKFGAGEQKICLFGKFAN